MIKKTSPSFQSIWLSIFVLLLSNLAMAHGRTISGNVFDPNACSIGVKVFAMVNGIDMGINTTINVSLKANVVALKDITTLSYISSYCRLV